jgi:excisionase family DNA binding protein
MSDHKLETSLEEIKKHLQATELQGKEILTLPEAALYAGVSKSYLYKLTSTKQIPFYRPALKLIYFKKQELTDWLLANKVEPIE